MLVETLESGLSLKTWSGSEGDSAVKVDKASAKVGGLNLPPSERPPADISASGKVGELNLDPQLVDVDTASGKVGGLNLEQPGRQEHSTADSGAKELNLLQMEGHEDDQASAIKTMQFPISANGDHQSARSNNSKNQPTSTIDSVIEQREKFNQKIEV